MSDSSEYALNKFVEKAKGYIDRLAHRQVNAALAPDNDYVTCMSALNVTLYTTKLGEGDQERFYTTVWELLRTSGAVVGMVAILDQIWRKEHQGWKKHDVLHNIEQKAFYLTLTFIQNVAWLHPESAIALCRVGMLPSLALILRFFNPSHFKKETNKVEEDILSSTICVCQNMAYCESIRSIFVEQGFVTLLLPYLATPNKYYRTSVIMCMSYIVNEDDSQLFCAELDHLTYIVDLLAGAIASSSGSHEGWTAYRLTRGLSTMAVNEINKRRIVQVGVIPHLTTMMDDNSCEKNQSVAVELLWLLSFDQDNKKDIRKERVTLTSLQRLTRHTNKLICKTALETLWSCDHYSSEMRHHTAGVMYDLEKLSRMMSELTKTDATGSKLPKKSAQEVKQRHTTLDRPTSAIS